MTQYAARYRAARAYAGLSQDELAERLGVDAQTVKRREAGSKEPKKAELIAVAAICGVPLEFMENGWGQFTPDEITRLLGIQNGILERIENATVSVDGLAETAKSVDLAVRETLGRLQAAVPPQTAEARKT